MEKQKGNQLQVIGSWHKPLLTTSESNLDSIYNGELTSHCVLESIKKIRDAFPGLPTGFFNIFQDRLKDHKFCDERLKDAVNYVIDNCQYPNPQIADFITYDKKILKPVKFNFNE